MYLFVHTRQCTKGRSIFSRSTENGPCLSIIASRATAFTGGSASPHTPPTTHPHVPRPSVQTASRLIPPPFAIRPSSRTSRRMRCSSRTLAFRWLLQRRARTHTHTHTKYARTAVPLPDCESSHLSPPPRPLPQPTLVSSSRPERSLPRSSGTTRLLSSPPTPPHTRSCPSSARSELRPVPINLRCAECGPFQPPFAALNCVRTHTTAAHAHACTNSSSTTHAHSTWPAFCFRFRDQAAQTLTSGSNTAAMNRFEPELKMPAASKL